jgi:hypothetical protein
VTSNKEDEMGGEFSIQGRNGKYLYIFTRKPEKKKPFGSLEVDGKKY